MSTRRVTGTDPCPLTDKPAEMDVCQPCRFFRGAVSLPGQGRNWNVCCNYPRDGSYLAPERPGWDVPIPAAILEAFEE